jgi:hypothetical protein
MLTDVTTVSARVVQVYEFHDAEDGNTYFWDATAGRAWAERTNAEIVSVHLTDMDMTPARILSISPDLDRGKALRLPGAALLSPLLFVCHRDKHVLIDGWHRLYKAAVQGIPCLPAYVLTHAQADAIRVTERASKT